MNHYADTEPKPTPDELSSVVMRWEAEESTIDLVMRAIQHGSGHRSWGHELFLRWAASWVNAPSREELDDMWYQRREPAIAWFYLKSANNPLEQLPRMNLTVEQGDTTYLRETLAVLIAETSPHTGIVALGGRMGQLYLRDRPGIKGEPVKSLEFNPLTVGGLASNLDKYARFTRLSRGKKNSIREILIDCPRTVVSDLLDRKDEWLRFGIPHVDCVSETPLFVPCKLIASRGLCQEVGAYVNAPAGVRIPHDADQGDALEALGRLREWLAEFPFETPVDESVALSLLLTAALRASVQPIPCYLLDKPSFGAGASTLASLVHIVMTGRRPAVLSADRGQDELGKQIDAAQMAGVQAIVIDNIPEGSEFQNESLAQSITESERKPRRLGQSENVTVPSNQLFILNGKNITVTRDLTRRTMVCRLNPKEQRIQDRRFKRPHILDEIAVPSVRARVLSDLYTVAGAYCRAGSEVASAGLLGFEYWTRLCASPLVWLGIPDPVQSNEKLEQEDPAKQDFNEVSALWVEVHGGDGVTVDDLLSGESSVVDAPAMKLAARLRQAAGVNARTESPARVVGKYLAKWRDNAAASGLRLARLGSKDNRAVWAFR